MIRLIKQCSHCNLERKQFTQESYHERIMFNQQVIITKLNKDRIMHSWYFPPML